jgi:DNA-binding transcriptional regulator YiaG
MEMNSWIIPGRVNYETNHDFFSHSSYEYVLPNKVAFTTLAILTVGFVGSGGDLCASPVILKGSNLIQADQLINTESQVTQDNYSLVISDETRLIVEYFGLNKKQAAEVLGITRQTLYDWLSDKTITPHHASIDRINSLKEVMEELPMKHSKFFGRFFNRKVVEQQFTLESLLTADKIDCSAIKNVYESLALHIDQVIKRQEAKKTRTNKTKLSKQDQLANIDSMTSTSL